jgi:hypothetical protein
VSRQFLANLATDVYKLAVKAFGDKNRAELVSFADVFVDLVAIS